MKFKIIRNTNIFFISVQLLFHQIVLNFRWSSHVIVPQRQNAFPLQTNASLPSHFASWKRMASSIPAIEVKCANANTFLQNESLGIPEYRNSHNNRSESSTIRLKAIRMVLF